MSHVKVFGCIVLAVCLAILGGDQLVVARAGHALPAGQTYYVSNGGNDSNNGLTPETAWRTINYVNQQTFQPGDSVLFRRGDVWRETLSVTSSGTSTAWITFGAYGSGDKPRILASELAIDWTPIAPNIWRSNTVLGNPYKGGYSYAEVFFKDLSGTHHWGKRKAYDATFSQMTSEYDWSWNANRIYVYAPANPGTRYAAVEVPQRDACIEFPNVDGVNVLPEDYVEYVAFDNLELMYAMQHGIYPGYNEIEAHGLRITNSHIGYIGVRGGSAAYCIAAWHSDMLIQNNEIHDCGRRGISLNTYTGFTPGLSVRNVTIDHNHFYNGFHTTGPDISSLPGRMHTFTNFTISHNLIDDSERWSEAINAGCYTSSCTSNAIYISAHDSHYSNFYLYNNIIVGSTSRAILLVDMDNVHVYHNTVYASHPGARPYALVILDNVSAIDLRNNLIYGTLPYNGGANDARCVMDQGTSSFAVRDYNLYHQADSAQPFTGSENGVGGWDTFIYEWDTWRAASGFETHSPHPQNPLFVDAAQGDFHLRADSAAVDAGVRINGFNDVYHGAAPDLGALEFTPSLTLRGTPADRTIYLNWSVSTALPVTTTWHIAYYTNTLNVLTATHPLSTARNYTLTGLTNYVWYTVTLDARLAATVLFSDTVRVMPTDIAVYLPLILLKQ